MGFIKSRKSTNQVSERPAQVVAGNLRLHELRSRIFRNSRMVRVWLPPGYDETGDRRYPVLYLNDGQNLFDPATAFAGVDWRVSVAAERLILEGKIPPLIIVGIDNTGESRLREYIPYRSLELRLFGPQGKRYPEFLLREAMPMIEKYYRVAKGPEHTGLGGSSLGGLITLYTQLAVPGVFGRVLIESPSLFVANRKILEECRQFRDWPYRIYLGMGTREAGNPAKDERVMNDVRELERILRAAGLGESRLKVWIEEGAGHHEAAWGARFAAAVEFLFAGYAVPGVTS
ncbi:MAG: esterase [Acidobacteria bacterium]|jgi:predicted alpha/beta superfamily hydrolase|nr:MAG: esterase [Acidobacteriota bacterium]